MLQKSLLAATVLGCSLTLLAQTPPPAAERRLTNIRQLTSGGENAEAYFSPDGRQLIYQTNPARRARAIRFSR